MSSSNRALPRAITALTEFLADESVGGILMLVASGAALVWANLAADGYTTFWHQTLTLGTITEDLQHWVNDGLMTVFFFLVGLEIKRELVVGELRGRRVAMLPALAAAGGVALPIVIFVLLAGSGPQRDGWGIPMATDIAFAVGVLTLLGRVCSGGAKLFLLSIAIVDDILAVLVIALFYSDGIGWLWLVAAFGGLAVIVAMRQLRVPSPWAYVPVGLFVWAATLESGVHPTIAGVVVGVITPTGAVGGRPVLEELEHRLHPVSAFVVVPVFALANAGVFLGGGVITDALGSTLALAVAAGLVFGKLLGIGLVTELALRAGWAQLPNGMERREIWGIAALCGVGFTVSLFVTDLALSDPGLITQAKVGLFGGSAISVLLAVGLLLLAHARGERRVASGAAADAG